MAEGVELHVAVARLEERIESLEAWQRDQNGSLQRLADRIDRLNWWIVGIAGGVAVACVMLMIQILLRNKL